MEETKQINEPIGVGDVVKLKTTYIVPKGSTGTVVELDDQDECLPLKVRLKSGYQFWVPVELLTKNKQDGND